MGFSGMGASSGADVGSAVGGLFGTLLGDWATDEDRQHQLTAIRQEHELYDALPTDLRAQQEQAYALGPSAYESLTIDPSTRAAQQAALSGYQQIAAQQGMDPQFRAAMAAAQQQSAQQERAQRGNILDTFARRGTGNSNAALMASLQAQQGSAQRAGMEGLQAGSEAAARQYRALGDSAALGGQMRGQDWQQASSRANAMDEVARYNAQNRQQVAARNTAAGNSFAQNNADLAYRRAGMLGGTYQQQGDYWQRREREKAGMYDTVGRDSGGIIGYAVGGAMGGG